MTSLSKSGEEYSFDCNQWFSNKDEEDVSLVEFPAIVKGKPIAEGKII